MQTTEFINGATEINVVQKAQLNRAMAIIQEQNELSRMIDNPIEFWDSPKFIIGRYKNECCNGPDDKMNPPYVFKSYLRVGNVKQPRIIPECSYTYEMQLLVTQGYICDGNNSQFAIYASRMLALSNDDWHFDKTLQHVK